MDKNIGQTKKTEFDFPKFYNTRQRRLSRSRTKNVNYKQNIFQFSKNPSTFSMNSKGTENTYQTWQTTQKHTSFNQSIQQVNNKSPIVLSSSEEKDQSKDEDHYIFKPNQLIDGRYSIVKILGEGTFGRVFQVKQIETNQIYALKMIRAVERFILAAKIEANILEKISKIPSALLLIEHFQFQNNYCLVFEQLGNSLYDFIKSNEFKGFPIEYIQSFFKQILVQMSYFHCLGLTHTDIKPENILLIHKGRTQYKKFKQFKQKIFVPKNDQIKIIDFGGATFDYEHHSTIINTRQYRAPEVMITAGQWNQKSDMWGIACVIVELYCGQLLFDTHQTYEHLAMIEKLSGQIPKNMIDKCKDELLNLFSRKKLKWPIDADDSTINRVKNMKVLNQIISPQHQDLLNLLQELLTIDPLKRLNCEQALQHPFFSIPYQLN